MTKIPLTTTSVKTKLPGTILVLPNTPTIEDYNLKISDSTKRYYVYAKTKHETYSSVLAFSIWCDTLIEEHYINSAFLGINGEHYSITVNSLGLTRMDCLLNACKNANIETNCANDDINFFPLLEAIAEAFGYEDVHVEEYEN